MKTLLRSLYLVERTDNPEEAIANYRDFLGSGLTFDTPEHNTIYEFVGRFIGQHGHAPSVETLRNHFKHAKDDGAYDQVEVISNIPSRSRGDFLVSLGIKVENKRYHIFTETMREAAIIASTGLEIKDGRNTVILRGPQDAVRYLNEKSHMIVAPSNSLRISGEATNDAQSFLEELDLIKADPLAGIGQYTFLKQMDDVLSGAKKFELWTHAAFTGGGKSTFAVNWAYSQAVFYGHSSLYYSLEMPYTQLRRIIYSLHSAHPKFRYVRMDLGLQKELYIDEGVPYSKLKTSTLTPNEEYYLREFVVPDLKGEPTKLQNPDPRDPTGRVWRSEYGKIMIEGLDPSKPKMTVEDIRTRAEVLYSHHPFALMIVDHAGLVDPLGRYSSTTDSLNEVLRSLKKLAMTFHQGLGMAVVALFQISREGYKSALKAQEKTGAPGYNLTHLSYANEAERSSDVVTASWIDDEMKKRKRVFFQCLKARDSDAFEPFVARIDWATRRMLTCFDIVSEKEAAERGAAIDKAVDET